MRSGVGLCVLGLLCLHSSVFGQEVAEVPPGVLIFCDDLSVEKAVHSAVTKFNEKLTSGNKLALFQTVTASKSENGADSVYSLQFTSRRSDCTAGSSKPWTDCDYLAVDRKPISCNATVYMTETETDTRQVDCVLDDYVVPERAQCLGCPQEIPDNSEDLRGPLTASIHKYNSMSDSTHLFAFNNVHHATRQVVAGLRYKLKFDMRRTNCAKAEHKDLNQLCVPDETNVEFANCNSTVDVAPWRHEPPQTQIECQPGELPMVFTRRRPPGWSPLRNLFYEVPSNVSTKPDPQPTPTKAAKEAGKEESSEEDTTAAKPSVSPDASPDSVSDAPFHCPSKPWKPFNPVSVAGTSAPEQVTGEATAQAAEPTPGGSFADTDLLG